MRLSGWFKRESTDYLRADELDIYELARKYQYSEYEIFCLAATNWNVKSDAIEEDFKNYLWFSLVPFYVRDLVRQEKVNTVTN